MESSALVHVQNVSYTVFGLLIWLCVERHFTNLFFFSLKYHQCHITTCLILTPVTSYSWHKENHCLLFLQNNLFTRWCFTSDCNIVSLCPRPSVQVEQAILHQGTGVSLYELLCLMAFYSYVIVNVTHVGIQATKHRVNCQLKITAQFSM